MQQNANKICDIDMDLVPHIDDLGKQICMISSGGFSSKFANILFFFCFFFVFLFFLFFIFLLVYMTYIISLYFRINHYIIPYSHIVIHDFVVYRHTWYFMYNEKMKLI